jgi:hypothetical protein
MHPRIFPDIFNKRVLLRRPLLANLHNSDLLDAKESSDTRRELDTISQMTCGKEGKDCGHVIQLRKAPLNLHTVSCYVAGHSKRLQE